MRNCLNAEVGMRNAERKQNRNLGILSLMGD
jgi:hypothetical protein